MEERCVFLLKQPGVLGFGGNLRRGHVRHPAVKELAGVEAEALQQGGGLLNSPFLFEAAMVFKI